MKGDIKKMGLENLQYPVEEDFYKLETWNTNTKILADAITASNTEITNSKNMIGDLSSLSTDDKTSAVLAINELFNRISNDTTGFVNVKSMETTSLKVDTIAKNHAETNGATNILRNPIWIKNNVSCKEVYPTLVQASDDLKVGSSISLKTLSGYVGAMSALSTSEKSSLVGAINEMLTTAKHMGLTGENLINRQINDDFTFSDLVHQSKVTFFTNWTDNTNFPQIYGSGVLIPCYDGGTKIIFYADVMGENAYLMHVTLAGPNISITTKCMTGYMNIPTTSVNISSVGTGSIEYNVVNGICHVMINDFKPSSSTYYKWIDICNLPKDKYGNDYPIFSHLLGGNTEYCCFKYNHNNNKLQYYTNKNYIELGYYATLSYPVAD